MTELLESITEFVTRNWKQIVNANFERIQSKSIMRSTYMHTNRCDDDHVSVSVAGVMGGFDMAAIPELL